MSYYENIQVGDDVAVSLGRCECGNNFPHPTIRAERVESIHGVFLRTEYDIYTTLNGNNLTYQGDDQEFYKILDPSESLDAAYVLNDMRMMELRDLIADTEFDDQVVIYFEELEELQDKQVELEERVLQRGYDNLLNG